MPFQNPELATLIPNGNYRAEALSRIETELRNHGTLTFARLPSGLFAASSAGESIASSGYANVWVRDNVYVAYAHHVSAQTPVAAGVARALLKFFSDHRHRFEAVISGAVSPQDASRRPHVRFDGHRLTEIPNQRWPHAQNDALGYFLWLYAKLAYSGHVALDEVAISMLALFPRYFEAIRFWQDEDSGHWEEVRKISASSIGTVVAGLDALLFLACDRATVFERQPFGAGLVKATADLLDRGRSALESILPHECAQLSPSKNRRYDAALLFLLFPLDVVKGPMADLLLQDVNRFLKGEFGIRRYLGDSYYAPDYEDRFPPGERTRDFSEDMEVRDALLERIGDEAQWCLFDPILSAYYGRRFLETRSSSDIEQQTFHFNRALAQITPSWRCPELYYLQHGAYVPNPHLPLQWTQANFVLALEAMRATIDVYSQCHSVSLKEGR
ncbi:MAG: phosphorylase kinase [Nitrospira sp.]|nr:phosphorylase kinase [Nitrospira sp.]